MDGAALRVNAETDGRRRFPTKPPSSSTVELESAEYGMRRLAERLDREALEQQADALAAALELDLIGADDFGR